MEPWDTIAQKELLGRPLIQSSPQQFLKIRDQHFGPHHPEVAETLNNLGNAHVALGDHRTKEEVLERVLKIEEQHFPEVTATLLNLGNVHGALGDLGRLSQKELLGRALIQSSPQQFLKIRDQHFGPHHPEVAATLNNLGNAHVALGDHRAKKEVLERVLKIEEQHFGADHPEVTATLLNLGNAHGALGDYRTQKELLGRALIQSSPQQFLKIREQHFGPDHSEVAATLNNLGFAHGALGHYHTQKELLERALKIFTGYTLVLTIHMWPLSRGIWMLCHLTIEIHWIECIYFDAVVQFQEVCTWFPYRKPSLSSNISTEFFCKLSPTTEFHCPTVLHSFCVKYRESAGQKDGWGYQVAWW